MVAASVSTGWILSSGRSLIWRWCESASLIIAWWLLCLLLRICGTVASRIIWLYSVRKPGKRSYLSYGDWNSTWLIYSRQIRVWLPLLSELLDYLMCTCLHQVIQQRQIYHRITWYRNVNIYTLAHCLLVCMFTCNNRYL